MRNILIIAAKPGLIFDPRDIKGSPEIAFEEWLEANFEFRIFQTQKAADDWIDRQGAESPDRYWAALSLADHRKGPWKRLKA